MEYQLRGSISASNASRRFSLNRFSAARYSGYFTPRIDAACSAELVAPALPTAIVATGMPAGICTMDSNESRPSSVPDLMGTPITGSNVKAAATPRQVGGAASACDQNFQASFFCSPDVFDQLVRRPVGRYDHGLVFNPQGIKHIGRPFHGGPIGFRTHDNSKLVLVQSSTCPVLAKRVLYQTPPAAKRPCRHITCSFVAIPVQQKIKYNKPSPLIGKMYARRQKIAGYSLLPGQQNTGAAS